MRKIILFISLYAIAFSSMSQQAPTLNTPADSATSVNVNTKLIWSASIGGLVFGYEVEVDKNDQFTNPISNFPVNGTAARTKELEFNTKYFWRVRAKGAGSTFSPWSSVRSFTTFNNQFKGLSPTSAKENPKVTLSWDTIPGVDTYYFEVADNASFLSPTSGSMAHPNHTFVLDQLKFNQSYYFRVWAEHGSDISAKSATATFKTKNVILLLSPDSSAANQTPRTELRCYHTPGVVSYKFQIDNSPSFDTNSLEYNVATVLDADFKTTEPISWFTSRLLYQEQYYWRVQAVNNTGKSAWTGARIFNTISKVALTSPMDESVNVPNKAKLKWVKIVGTEKYEVQIDSDVNFSDPKVYFTNSDTSNTISVTFTEWTEYFWRVRSTHAKDVSAWSDVWSFTVHPTGIDETKGISFNISPNPADDMIQLQMSKVEFDDIQVDIYNTLGTKVSSYKVSNRNTNGVVSLDVSDLKAGAYMMTVEAGDVQSSQRLIIR